MRNLLQVHGGLYPMADQQPESTAMNAPVANLRVPTHPVDAQFLNRWSPRAFSEATMTEPEVLSVLEAARWAPSASNNQPWRFVWGLRGDAGFAAILDGLVPFNQMWAGKAAALVMVASKTTVAGNEGEAANPYHAFDTGTSWGHLALQAHLNGFITHGMAGFDHVKMAANLHLPEGYALHAAVAIGRQGDAAGLPDMLRAREVQSGRLALSEVARHGSFA